MTAFSGFEDTCVSEAFELIDNLRSLSSADAIALTMADALTGLGFHAFLMTRLPARNERIDPYILIMSWPRDWLLRYGRQGHYANDPVAQTCFGTLRPFEWSNASWNGCDTERGRRVMREATDFDLNDGVMVPMHDLNGRQASFSMATKNLDLPPSGLKAIHLISLYAFASADDALVDHPRLSAREREVLAWTAQEKGTWEVGEILQISQSTVATHLKNAKHKVDGTTITHTVVQALRRREIQL